jgi:hypothetical protein
MAKRAEERKPLMVRIPAELVDRIDATRDPLVPRERWIRALLEAAADQAPHLLSSQQDKGGESK